MATEHLTIVETVDDLPDPVPGVRAAVSSENSVYVTKSVKGALKWVFETKLATPKGA